MFYRIQVLKSVIVFLRDSRCHVVVTDASRWLREQDVHLVLSRLLRQLTNVTWPTWVTDAQLTVEKSDFRAMRQVMSRSYMTLPRT